MVTTVARKAKCTALNSPISAAWSSAEDAQEAESLFHVPQFVTQDSISVCAVLAYLTPP